MSQLIILACQVAIPAIANANERDRHVRHLVALITELVLAQPNVDLVVLPELSTVDYSRASFDRLDELAETLDGTSFQAFAQLAKQHQVAIVFGMPRQELGNYYISQVVIDAQGAYLGHYDKIHIAQFGDSMEKDYFQRGQHLCVVDIKGVRLAPIICYDIRIPELTRQLVTEHQVDCILHCGAYARDESFYSWHDFVVTRAMENQVYCVSLNRAGEHFGESAFCLPWMDEAQKVVKFAAHEAGFKVLTVDLEEIKKVRNKYTFLKDRLAGYKALKVVPKLASKN